MAMVMVSMVYCIIVMDVTYFDSMDRIEIPWFSHMIPSSRIGPAYPRLLLLNACSACSYCVPC